MSTLRTRLSEMTHNIRTKKSSMYFLRIVTIIAIVVIDYCVVVMTALGLTPKVAVLVAENIGITKNMTPTALMVLWLLPTAIILGFVCVLEFIALRGLWRFGMRLTMRAVPAKTLADMLIEDDEESGTDSRIKTEEHIEKPLAKKKK